MPENRPALSAVTDADLRALTDAERRALIARLSRMSSNAPRSHADRRKVRRNRIAFIIFVAVALVPWTIYLGMTLPGDYVVRDWTLTWTGFDVILTAMIFSTALLALLRRQLVILVASISATLLVGDAWFDVTTSSGGDRLVAVLFALCLELPFAGFLFSSALRLLRLTSGGIHLDQGISLWRRPLLPGEWQAPAAEPVPPVTGVAG